MKKGLVLVLALLMAPGCAAVAKMLPTIVQYVQDAAIVLDQIDATAKPFIDRGSDEQLKQDYSRAMQVTRQSLQVALRASKGTEDLTREQVDEAFGEFREAYKELLAVLQRAGVMRADGTMSAAPGMSMLEIREPLAAQSAE